MTAAWLGCQIPLEDATDERAWAIMTPGGQTPVPSPNDAGLGYYEYLPAGYGTGADFPLVIFFHDANQRGNGSLEELPRVLEHGPPKLIEAGVELPAIVISPQIDVDAYWSPSITTPFVDHVLSHHDVDRERVYVTGAGMGGEGTWLHAKDHPDLPAAIVPICAPDNSTGHDVLRAVPTWTFHRIEDLLVPIGETEDVLERVTGVRPVASGNEGKTGYFQAPGWSWRDGQAAPAAGENPAFTVYPGAGHDAWTAAYDHQEMWDWLFGQRRSVFRQSFDGSAALSDYENPIDPTIGQLDDIDSQATGGTFSINAAGRLQLVRTGSDISETRKAAIVRWTDLAGPPAVLHASFDVGVSSWTKTTFQAGAMVLSFAKLTGPIGVDKGDVAIGTFQTVIARGKGPGLFAVMTQGIESPVLPANGTLQRVDVFLNKSGAAASYRAPDGSLHSLQDNGVALWVNGAAVVVSTAASNGSQSTLTDFRIRWAAGDDATWVLDNVVVRRDLPR